MNRRCALFFSLALLAAAPAPVWADDDDSSEESGWGFDISLDLFLPSQVVGDVEAGLVQDSLDLTLRDLLNDFDVTGIAGQAEFWTPFRLGVRLAGLYQRSEFEDETVFNPGGAIMPTTVLGTDTRLGWGDLAVAGRLLDTGDSVKVQLDLFGGVRFFNIQNTLELALPRRDISQGTSYTSAEILVGGRIKARFWIFYASLLVDASGFGIGTASDLTWNFIPAIGVQPGDLLSIELGYRVLGVDFSRGSGSKAVGYDVLQHGLQLSVGVHF